MLSSYLETSKTQIETEVYQFSAPNSGAREFIHHHIAGICWKPRRGALNGDDALWCKF